MKLTAALVALAAANPANERTFADDKVFMLDYEKWWNPTISANYLANIEAAIPAFERAFNESDATDRIKSNFSRDMAKLVSNLKKAKGRCDNKASAWGRKRRAPDERALYGYGEGRLQDDIKELWWEFAKWTRNEFWYCEAKVDSFKFYKRIDRYRWIYMRHFCNYVDSSPKYCSWATLDSQTGKPWTKPFRKMNWFNKKYGKNAPNPLE